MRTKSINKLKREALINEGFRINWYNSLLVKLMKWNLLSFVLLFCSACGKDELPPREISLLENWDVKEVLTSWNFSHSYKTQFINEWVGYRMDILLFKTTDGGRNYTAIFELPYSPNPPALFALDESHLWLTTTRIDEENKTSFALIYRSVDGGDTWEISERENTFFKKISFVSPKKGFAYAVNYTGSYDDSYQLFKTEDGGSTWSVMSEVDMSQINLQRFLWKTRDLGFLVGQNGAHYRTLDGGQTWTPFRSNRSEEESIFYPIDQDQYYDMRYTETLKGDWSSGTQTKLDQPIYILTQTGLDIIGVLLEEGCLPYTSCENYLMSSLDGGKTWQKHQGVPFDVIFSRDQEIQPGLVAISDWFSAKVILIQKK